MDSPRLFSKERFREEENAADKKKWSDNITEWTKKTFAETQGSRTQPWIVGSIGATVLNGGAPTTLKNRVMGKKKKSKI